MSPTPLQQKLLVACCGCAAVAAALLPGALSHSEPPAPEVLSVGVAAHPAPHEAHRHTTRVSAGPSASNAALPSQARPQASAGQTGARRTVVTPHVSATPELPAPVSALHLASATPTTMVLAWHASADAASYRVLLDGVQVATVGSPSATIAWPGSSRVLVQVAAVDAHGVASELRSLVLVRVTAAGVAASQAPAPTTSQTPPTPAPSNPVASQDAASGTHDVVPSAATVDDAGSQLAAVAHQA